MKKSNQRLEIYNMNIVDSSVLKQLKKISRKSHKGDNGRVLVISGSDKYHGAMLLTVQSASRIVDIVYVHSVEKNLKLIDKLRNNIATFISVSDSELWGTMELVDVVMIGPGLEESKENLELTEKILKQYKSKKIIIDATAFWHLNPELLHSNCIVTPHKQEFENTFKVEANPENVLKMANQYGCVIVLTGPQDYISDGNILYENQTGNAGMTKGGTGDVLVGLVGALFAKNDALTSALAGAYLNGLAGDRLYEEKSTFYNAGDVVSELGKIWGELMK